MRAQTCPPFAGSPPRAIDAIVARMPADRRAACALLATLIGCSRGVDGPAIPSPTTVLVRDGGSVLRAPIRASDGCPATAARASWGPGTLPRRHGYGPRDLVSRGITPPGPQRRCTSSPGPLYASSPAPRCSSALRKRSWCKTTPGSARSALPRPRSCSTPPAINPRPATGSASRFARGPCPGLASRTATIRARRRGSLTTG